MTPKSLYRQMLRSKNYKIKFVYVRAFATYEEGIIRINLHRNNSALKNYIHEMLHHLYPKMSHPDVYHWESVLWKELSIPQKLKLYRRLFG